MLHGRPVLLWEGGWGRIHGSEGRRYVLWRPRVFKRFAPRVMMRISGVMGTHVEAMQNSSGSAFCLPPSLIFLHGCFARSSGGWRAVAIASASSVRSPMAGGR